MSNFLWVSYVGGATVVVVMLLVVMSRVLNS
jgi:hypothetical protein